MHYLCFPVVDLRLISQPATTRVTTLLPLHALYDYYKLAMPEKGRIYARELGIDLDSGDETEYFKWFLACLLFGKPVQQSVASRTYSELVKHDITSPEDIQQAGWDRLVEILDEGHYVRYDYSTADKLLDVSAAIKEHGSFGNFLHECKDVEDASSRLQEIKGVGPKTVEIFMRDMVHILRENSPEE